MQPVAGRRQLVHPTTRFELPLLDPQVARKLRIVAAHVFYESLGVLAPDERVDGVAERGSSAPRGSRTRAQGSDVARFGESRGAYRGTYGTSISGILGTLVSLNHAVSAQPCD